MAGYLQLFVLKYLVQYVWFCQIMSKIIKSKLLSIMSFCYILLVWNTHINYCSL